MKPKLPKIGKLRKTSAGHLAFGGGAHAFGAPSAMVTPDQAFKAAMEMPQGEQPSVPAMPNPQG